LKIKEVKVTPFVSIILDEATDIATKSQLPGRLRNVTNVGSVQKGFLNLRPLVMTEQLSVFRKDY
jgi:hypothetical protein